MANIWKYKITIPDWDLEVNKKNTKPSEILKKARDLGINIKSKRGMI